MFMVDPKTVIQWASVGCIGSIRAPGGHPGSASER
jgi:hypothetical protein